MKVCCSCTALFGLAPESATTSFTSLPSTPLVILGAIFLISSWPSLMCSTASCHAFEFVFALHRIGAGARHGGADGDGRALPSRPAKCRAAADLRRTRLRTKSKRPGTAKREGAEAGAGCDRLTQEAASRNSDWQKAFLSGHRDLPFCVDFRARSVTAFSRGGFNRSLLIQIIKMNVSVRTDCRASARPGGQGYLAQRSFRVRGCETSPI